jgi:alpha-L-rhamnosidase
MGTGHRGTLWCEYTKGTAGEETWSPKFFYVGCRYLQLHLNPATPNSPLPVVKSVTGLVMHSSSPAVGEFECSSDLFNRIRRLVRWAQRSNMVSLLTDCPHRERLGWLEEDHLNGPALRYEFDLNQLFTKILNDIADSQLTNGLVPTIAPEYTIFRDKNDTQHLRGMFGDSPEWSATFILVPWQQYEYSGDLELFRRHYDAMKAYVAYLGSRATNHIVNYGLGDWYDVGPGKPGVSQLTPIALTATAFYFENVKIMSQAAALLNQPEDARQFSELAAAIRTAFNQHFFQPASNTYATGSQCANAIPLVMNLCEPTNRAAVVEAIVQDVRAHGNALTAGDVGYRYLLRALADGGRSDVIFELNNQTNHPGYGMQLAKGKTSLTEAWDGGASQNHFMLGQIQEWFYHDLAGIQSVSNGFKQIRIAPQPVGDLTWVRASYQSIRGKIVSNCQRTPKEFTLKISIPANTTAEVSLPAASAAQVKAPRGATFLRQENQRAIYSTGSGDYTFTARLQ